MRFSISIPSAPPVTERAEATRSGRALQLSLLTLAATVAIYARSALGPLQEHMRIALALSDNQIALLQGPALALAMVLSAIPLGLVIDRYVRVRVVLILALFNVVGSLLTAWSFSFSMLFAARCLVGFTGTATFIVSVSIISDLFAPAQRGRATMAVTVGAVFGMAAAFALGGALLAMAGPAPNAWRWAMGWMSVPLVPVMLLMLLLREPPRAGVAIANASAREAYAELWRYRAMFLPLLIGLVMVEIAAGGTLIWTAPTLSRRFDLPPDQIGAIVAMALLVSGILGPILGGGLADLCQRTSGPSRTMSALTAMALLSVPCGLFAVAPSVEWVSILLVTFLTIGLAFNVTVPALTTIVIPNEVRGICLALMSAASMLCAFGLAPVMVSSLSGAMGGPATIGKALALVCAVSSVIGVATFAFARRYFPKSGGEV